MEEQMLRTRKYLLAAGAVATAITLSACTSGGSSGMDGMDMGGSSEMTNAPTASASFNAADVTFVQMMIPHHEQAVEMSDDLLAKDGVDPRVVAIATQIKAAQEPEIKQLKKWLTTWGADQGGMSDMPGMDNGADGLMSADDMTALKNASGAEASKLFLQQMMVHHKGAIAMSQIEIDAGENADAKAKAIAIVKVQTDEVVVMTKLLATL
jgi:uncharacterized protein (DUF305 family)